jgi:hypothetical protein
MDSEQWSCWWVILISVSAISADGFGAQSVGGDRRCEVLGMEQAVSSNARKELVGERRTAFTNNLLVVEAEIA